MQHRFKIKNASIMFVFLTGFAVFSQNLVLNPDFEEFKDCPWDIGMFNNNVKHWSSPNRGSTDFFRSCLKTGKVYENYNGKQHPASGKGYAGMYCYAMDDYREYVQGELSKTLEQGKQYEMSFHISLSEASAVALKSLSVLFTQERIGYEMNKTSVFNTPDSHYARFSNITEKFIDLNSLKVAFQSVYRANADHYYNDVDNWEKITFIYTAKGQERFFTIGNFKSNSETERHEINTKDENPFAYYYIDNITIHEIAPYQVEKTYTFSNVLFDFDKATLLPISKIELDSLYSHLKNHPKLKVEIYGHTDAVGTLKRNEQLSLERAKAVEAYLIQKGLSPESVEAFGFGSAKPIDTNTTETGRSQNRRVEFKLIEQP